MSARILAFTLAAALVSGVVPAAAQAPPAWKGLVTASVDVGIQATSTTAESTVTYKVYGEDASVKTSYDTKTGSVFGARAGVRVWRHLIVGGGFGLFSDSHAADVTAKIPHPFLFQRPRDVEGSAPGITRDESVVYGEIGWLLPLTAKIDMVVFGGPAFFSATQQAVVKLQYTETYPYDTATFSSADTVSKDVSATGYTVGADITYRFTKNVGVGALIRFSRATADGEPVAGQRFGIDLGGGQVTAGLRVRF